MHEHVRGNPGDRERCGPAASRSSTFFPLASRPLLTCCRLSGLYGLLSHVRLPRPDTFLLHHSRCWLVLALHCARAHSLRCTNTLTRTIRPVATRSDRPSRNFATAAIQLGGRAFSLSSAQEILDTSRFAPRRPLSTCCSSHFEITAPRLALR